MLTAGGREEVHRRWVTIVHVAGVVILLKVYFRGLFPLGSESWKLEVLKHYISL